MNWLEVTIDASKEGLEIITGILLQLGVTGFVIQDPDDFDEFLTYQGKTWDYMDEDVEKLKDCNRNIKFYLAENIQGQETFIEIKNTLERLKTEDTMQNLGTLALSLGNVNEEDWANNWKKYFKPFEVGQQFVVKPTWEHYDASTTRKILEIDPNSSFGTGQHYTTQLCIEQLEDIIKPGDQVLDMGCGSGILAIATILLGAGHVTAVDIDQNSVDIARDNFIQNKLEPNKFTLHCGNVLGDDALCSTLGVAAYDVVVANICSQERIFEKLVDLNNLESIKDRIPKAKVQEISFDSE